MPRISLGECMYIVHTVRFDDFIIVIPCVLGTLYESILPRWRNW